MVKDADYSKMTDDEFYYTLQDLVRDNSGELLTIPGAYEVFSEYFNNKVLERWAEANPEKAYPEEYGE